MASLIQLCLVPFMDGSGLFLWVTAIFSIILVFNIVWSLLTL